MSKEKLFQNPKNEVLDKSKKFLLTSNVLLESDQSPAIIRFVRIKKGKNLVYRKVC
jgi:hypothetical protein